MKSMAEIQKERQIKSRKIILVLAFQVLFLIFSVSFIWGIIIPMLVRLPGAYAFGEVFACLLAFATLIAGIASVIAICESTEKKFDKIKYED